MEIGLEKRRAYASSQGDHYLGQWVKGGLFSSDRYQGRGVRVTKEGEIQDGYFQNGVMSGQIRIINADGATYIGQAKDGYRDGHGDQLFANTQRYVGSWHANKMEGIGIYSYPQPTSSKYEGSFHQNEFHGKGKFTDNLGNTTAGEWCMGERL